MSDAIFDPAIGIDIGNHKLKAVDGSKNFIVDSIVKHYSAFNIPKNDYEILEFEGVKYLVGLEAMRDGEDLSPVKDKYVNKNIILILYSVAKLYPENEFITPWLTIGLPMGAHNYETTQIIMKDLAVKEHEILIGTKKDFDNKTVRRVCIKIAEMNEHKYPSRFKIIPESFGTFINKYYHINSGNTNFSLENPKNNNNVCVIDVGFFLTQLVIVKIGVNNCFVDESKSRYQTLGIKHLFDFIKEDLRKKYPTDITLMHNDSEFLDISDSLLTKKLKIDQKEYDIAEEIETAKIKFANELKSFIDLEWSIDILYGANEIIITGGGGKLIYDILQEHEILPVKITLADDSHMANAYGFYKQAFYNKSNSKK